jgi:drug/metabolite transporter (DMT)-like permease
MHMVALAVLISCWFASNIVLLLLNKSLLSSYAFHFPVFLTACHMLCASLVCLLLRPLSLVPREPLRSRGQRNAVLALSAVFCCSVVAGNTSLRFLPVSFNQAVSSTDPAFTALFAFVLQGRCESRRVYRTLVPIVLGTAIASGVRLLAVPAAINAHLLCATSVRASLPRERLLLLHPRRRVTQPEERDAGRAAISGEARIVCCVAQINRVLLTPLLAARSCTR